MGGAHEWIVKRVGALKGKSEALEKELQELDPKVVALQQQLDDNAAKFVKALNQLYDLVEVQQLNWSCRFDITVFIRTQKEMPNR